MTFESAVDRELSNLELVREERAKMRENPGHGSQVGDREAQWDVTWKLWKGILWSKFGIQ